jgi:hypothetical protein
MRRERLINAMVGSISLVLMYSGFFLLWQNRGADFSHLFSSPLLLLGKIILPMAMGICGLVGYINILRIQRGQQANASSRDFDAQEAFQQVRAGTIPEGWSVFRVKREKALAVSLASSLIPLAAMFYAGVMLFFVTYVFLMPFYQIVMALFLCITLCLMVLTPIFAWKVLQNKVLLITPDGFMQGDCRKPRKALRLKYRDIEDIKIIGETVSIKTKDGLDAKTLNDFLLAPSFKEIAATLLAAFVYYKADYPDGIVTAAPVFVSRFERERKRG